MMDKPTLKEFIWYRSGRYVETQDGTYYIIKNNIVSVIQYIVSIIILAVLYFVLVDIPWGGQIFRDALIAILLIRLLFILYYYRIARLARIEQGTKEYQKALGKPINTNSRIGRIITVSLLIIVLSIFSYSLAYLRSLTDTPVAECHVSSTKIEDAVNVSMEDGDKIIRLNQKPDSEIRIRITVSRTPETPVLMLDGKAVETEGIHRYSSFWFESDYFNQTGYYIVNAEDIRDGSVLTLTCGDWQYEWEFSIP